LIKTTSLYNHNNQRVSAFLVDFDPAQVIVSSIPLVLSTMPQPKVIIIGGGVGAIAMAHTLKWKLGVTNFEV
jgi:glycerate-2-kinase